LYGALDAVLQLVAEVREPGSRQRVLRGGEAVQHCEAEREHDTRGDRHPEESKQPPGDKQPEH
jgi:hypothetical protein